MFHETRNTIFQGGISLVGTSLRFQEDVFSNCRASEFEFLNQGDAAELSMLEPMFIRLISLRWPTYTSAKSEVTSIDKT
ncbi:hypothetical protein ACTXT7_015751 [Hymenolepis weldensis]